MYLYNISYEKTDNHLVEKFSSYVVSDNPSRAIDIVEENKDNIRIVDVEEKKEVQFVDEENIVCESEDEDVSVEDLVYGIKENWSGKRREAEIKRGELYGYDTIYVTINAKDMASIKSVCFSSGKLPEGWSIGAIWVKNDMVTIRVAEDEAIDVFKDKVDDRYLDDKT